jgi:hypothetical protein
MCTLRLHRSLKFTFKLKWAAKVFYFNEHQSANLGRPAETRTSGCYLLCITTQMNSSILATNSELVKTLCL